MLRGIMLLSALVGGLAFVSAGCAGANKNQESDDEVVGEPPSQSEDPFELLRTPPDAEEAPTSGYIGAKGGDEEDEEEAAAERAEISDPEPTEPREPTEPTEPESGTESGADTQAPEETAETSGESAPIARAEKADPDREQRPPKGTAGNEYQCFSCIRLCGLDESGQFDNPDCPTEGEDVICGWGVHPEKENARTRARAECEGALEMTRQMPTWSRIEGKCPTPTCR